MQAAGDLAPNKWESFNQQGPIKCTNGLATVVAGDPMQTFRCENVSEESKLLWTRNRRR